MGDVLWWSRGVENAAWASIHETERQLVAFLAPAERVRVHLLEVQALLREVKSPPAIAIADGIRDSLGPTKAGDANREQEQRALLARSLQFLNTDRDKTFAALMEWQNKASWLMLTAAIIILFLTVTVGNAELFLAGAAGGFLSRLARALKNDDIPLDYGASWTTLFLSPIFGALVGWFGIALIKLLTQPESAGGCVQKGQLGLAGRADHAFGRLYSRILRALLRRDCRCGRKTSGAFRCCGPHR
jgi:hypothetical protein